MSWLLSAKNNLLRSDLSPRLFGNVAANELSFGFLRGDHHNHGKVDGEDGDDEKKVGDVAVPVSFLRSPDGEDKISDNHHGQAADENQKSRLHFADADSKHH